MEKSMALLKQEHGNKLQKLTGILNKLKKELILKDISDFCMKTDFSGCDSHIYGKEIAKNIYAKATDATDGEICLFIEDRRTGTVGWMFEIVFEKEFYCAPYIFIGNAESKIDNLRYVENIDDNTENEDVKALVQEAIDKLEQSISIVREFDKDSVKYSYSCDRPEIFENCKFDDAIKHVHEFKR